MKTKELLENHPKSTNAIKQWMVDQMVNSFKDESVPEEFKEWMRKESIEDKNLIAIIDSNPRLLFDVFDENEIYIGIEFIISTPTKFKFTVGRECQENRNTRKEAERAAVERAFEILEGKL